MKFNFNDIVVVDNPSLKTHGQIGKVTCPYYHATYVKLDSGKTVYYSNDNLKRTTRDEEECNKMYITGEFKVAKVKFLSGNNTDTEYEYALFDDFNVGDIVVVSAKNSRFSIAKISAVIEKDEAYIQRFEQEVVAKIDLSQWEARVENRKRMQELNDKMEKRAQELNKLAVFEMLAEKDPSLKSMLDEYKELVGG
ncbi:MAG: hypothetical protein IKU41_02545 [Clostridia bacterium]|nr:hypothetical protein [Clostridia bacterium]